MTNGDAKLSKKDRKKLKKLNSGEAVVAPSSKEDATGTAAPKSDKKVQFAENLEQGPTKSTKETQKADKKGKKADAEPKKADKEKKAEPAKSTAGVREVQGVKIDDRTPGAGPGAKKGDRVQVRYIGKLDNGKVFDCTCL